MATINIRGLRFGKLVAKHETRRTSQGTYWHCDCDCGGSCEARGCELRGNRKTSCGCDTKQKRSLAAGGRPSKDGKTKTCSRCLRRKKLSEFWKDARMCDGHKSYCRTCGRKEQEDRDAAREAEGLPKTATDAYRRLRVRVLTHYSGGSPCCACCGEPRLEFLTLDHVNGGGTRHRKEIGSSGIFRWLRSRGFPEGYRVLCMNCNHALGHYGYCPHQRKAGKE